jgi:crotonobetainyl-CoA:carnitine CoA-transferase CaiB-like acyl-CoA transferase
MFARNAARVARRAEPDGLVARALGAPGRGEAVARLEEAGIACARLRDPRERRSIRGGPRVSGGVRWVRRWGRCGRCCLRITLPGGKEARMGDVPALGRHTGALPRAVGMTDDGVAALRRDGVAA